jgi:spore germination cell wall hydrolase CwlJ-like protein
MTHSDYAFTALCLWREARDQETAGLTAVACVIRNRVNKRGTTPFAEIVKPWAFSSMTAKGDPELTLYPTDNDPQWVQAQLIAGNVLDGLTGDITGGSTLYYNPKSISTTATFTLPNGTSIPWPERWNQARAKYACTIGAHVFFIE